MVTWSSGMTRGPLGRSNVRIGPYNLRLKRDTRSPETGVKQQDPRVDDVCDTIGFTPKGTPWGTQGEQE